MICNIPNCACLQTTVVIGHVYISPLPQTTANMAVSPLPYCLWLPVSHSGVFHLLDLRPVILDPLEPRQDSSAESASSWSLSALDEAASRVHLSSLDFGSNPRVVRERSSSAGTRRVQMLTHESSMEQESSQLSQDSSNGSISQAEELAEESSLSLDTSLRFRTALDSPSTSTPLGGGSPTVAEVTHATGLTTPTASAASVRGQGTSVIVGGRTEGSSGSGSGTGGGASMVGAGPGTESTPQEEADGSGTSREETTHEATPQGEFSSYNPLQLTFVTSLPFDPCPGDSTVSM